jgi:hypothetical protein
MHDEGLPEKVNKGKLYNTRQMGKLRLRWEDVRTDTSQILGKQGFWKRAEKREERSHLLWEARAQKGL